MDALRLRARFGPQLRLVGGIDKRAMIAGPEATDAELAQVVPLRHYLYCVQRMKQASLAPDKFLDTLS